VQVDNPDEFDAAMDRFDDATDFGDAAVGWPRSTEGTESPQEDMEVEPGRERSAGSSRRVPGSGQHRALAHSGGGVSDVFSLDQLASTDGCMLVTPTMK
jgi:hypothetical protein